MTRTAMIQALVNQVEDWDLDTIIEYAQELLKEKLSTMTDIEVREWYELTQDEDS